MSKAKALVFSLVCFLLFACSGNSELSPQGGNENEVSANGGGSSANSSLRREEMKQVLLQLLGELPNNGIDNDALEKFVNMVIAEKPKTRAHSSNASVIINNPVVSVANSREAGTRGSQLYDIPFSTPFNKIAVEKKTRFQWSFAGNLNFDGCTVTEFVAHTVEVEYSLDNGNNWALTAGSSLVVHNGGTDFNLSRSFVAEAASEVLFRAKVMFQLGASLPDNNCISRLTVGGNFAVVEQEL